jgi:hypothetical protein
MKLMVFLFLIILLKRIKLLLWPISWIFIEIISDKRIQNLSKIKSSLSKKMYYQPQIIKAKPPLK